MHLIQSLTHEERQKQKILTVLAHIKEDMGKPVIKYNQTTKNPLDLEQPIHRIYQIDNQQNQNKNISIEKQLNSTFIKEDFSIENSMKERRLSRKLIYFKDVLDKTKVQLHKQQSKPSSTEGFLLLDDENQSQIENQQKFHKKRQYISKMQSVEERIKKINSEQTNNGSKVEIKQSKEDLINRNISPARELIKRHNIMKQHLIKEILMKRIGLKDSQQISRQISRTISRQKLSTSIKSFDEKARVLIEKKQTLIVPRKNQPEIRNSITYQKCENIKEQAEKYAKSKKSQITLKTTKSFFMGVREQLQMISNNLSDIIDSNENDQNINPNTRS